MQQTPAPARLRALLKQDGMIVAPGAYDCISARVIAQAGFPAVYMTAAGTAAMLGYPDFGLVTMSEMAENAGRLAAAVTVPVIADADTGYRHELHATATARGNPDFLLIARTDSRAVIGFEEAVTRMNAALKAGADMAFLEAPQTPEEGAAVPRLRQGPCLLNVVSGGKTPVLDLAEAQKLGFKLAILPGLLFQTAVPAFDAVLADVKATQRHPDMKVSIREKFRRMGSGEWDALRTRFRDDTGTRDGGVKTAAE